MRSRTSRFALGGVALVVLAMVTGACSSGSGGDTGPVKIGAILELTGPGAAYGTNAREAIELALDEVERKVGGRQIEILYEDNATDPGTTLSKARKLIEQDGVDVLFGPIFSNNQDAMASYLAQQKIMSVAPIGASWDLSSHANWVVYPGTLYTYCTGAGKWLYEQGHRTMTTLGADYVAGRDFIGEVAEEFEAAGGEVVQQQWAPLGTLDFAPYLSAVEDADIFAMWTIMPDRLSFLKAYYDLDVQPELFLCEAENVTTDHLNEVGEEMLGTKAIVAAYSTELNNELNHAFVAAMQEKYGRVPTNADGTAYIGFNILLEGLKATSGDTTLDTLRPAILGLELDTLMGPISFSSNGFAKSNKYIVEVVKGEDGRLTWSGDPLETVTDVVDPRDK